MSVACAADGGDCTGYVCGAADTGVDDCVKAGWWGVRPRPKTPEMEEMERHHMHGPAQAAIALCMLSGGAVAACHFQRTRAARRARGGYDGTRGHPPGSRIRRAKRHSSDEAEAELENLENLGDEAVADDDEPVAGSLLPRAFGQVVVAV